MDSLRPFMPIAKKALVIAVSTYAGPHPSIISAKEADSNQPFIPDLRNPVNDASLVSSSLEKLGYEVTFIINPEPQKMHDAFCQFCSSIQQQQLSVVYFSGHGTAFTDLYLIPSISQLPSKEDLDKTLVSVSHVKKLFSGIKSSVFFLFLDCCRSVELPYSTLPSASSSSSFPLASPSLPEKPSHLTPPSIASSNFKYSLPAPPKPFSSLAPSSFSSLEQELQDMEISDGDVDVELTRSLRYGGSRASFNSLSTASNYFHGYSTCHSSVALDGKGKTSAFAEALSLCLNDSTRSSWEISRMFASVREEVVKLSQGKQHPECLVALNGDYIYSINPSVPPPVAAAAAPAPPSTQLSEEMQELMRAAKKLKSMELCQEAMDLALQWGFSPAKQITDLIPPGKFVSKLLKLTAQAFSDCLSFEEDFVLIAIEFKSQEEYNLFNAHILRSKREQLFSHWFVGKWLGDFNNFASHKGRVLLVSKMEQQSTFAVKAKEAAAIRDARSAAASAAMMSPLPPPRPFPSSFSASSSALAAQQPPSSIFSHSSSSVESSSVAPASLYEHFRVLRHQGREGGSPSAPIRVANSPASFSSRPRTPPSDHVHSEPQ